ncbi:MAG: OB-fold protein [Sphingomonadales bacterium]
MHNKKKWLRWILLAIVVMALAGGAVFYYVMTAQFADTSSEKPAYSISAMDLLAEFQQNDSAANKKYTEQIIAVSGLVSEVEGADTSATVKFVDTLTGSYLIFDFQPGASRQAAAIQPGANVTLKGSCSGSIYSRLRNAHMISFKRSVIIQ